MGISDFESLSASAQSIATIIALAIGAWWTFLVFVRKRERYPRAKTTHSVIVLGEVGDRILVRTSVKIENVGEVLLDLTKGLVRVHIVRPTPSDWETQIETGTALRRTEENEFEWPIWDEFPLAWEKAGYRIEPKESDEFHFDSTLDQNVDVIQIYSYFQNVMYKRKELGWNCTTVQRVRRNEIVANDQEGPKETKQGPPKAPSPPPPPQAPPKR